MQGAPELALAWRDATRSVFAHYLARGYEVRELLRPRGNEAFATYHMEKRSAMDREGGSVEAVSEESDA